MIELYGNKIWNSNTPNKYKKVIIASEDSLDNKSIKPTTS